MVETADDRNGGFGRQGDGSGMGGFGRGGDSAGPGGGNVGIGRDGTIIGLNPGGYSAVDPNNPTKSGFQGVVDPSLNGFERFGRNFKTNLNIFASGFKDKSAMGKLGTITSLLNPRNLVLLGMYTTGKSLAQTLSMPGLTAEDKQAIKDAAAQFDSLPDEQKTAFNESFKASNRDEDGKPIINDPVISPPNDNLNPEPNTNTGTTTESSFDYKYDMNNPQMMTEFVNNFMNNAYGEYKKRAEGVADATGKFQGTIGDLNKRDDESMEKYTERLRLLSDNMTDQQNTLLQNYINSQNSSLASNREKQEGLYNTWDTRSEGYLDSLIKSLDENANSTLPTVRRSVGSQEYQWIPKANRAAANDARETALGLFDRSSGLAKDKFAGGSGMYSGLFDNENKVATDTWRGGSDIAQNIWTEGNDVMGNLYNAETGNTSGQYGRAKDSLQNSIAAAMSGDGTLDYISALASLAELENNRSATDKGIAVKSNAIAAEAEANEPGWLDILKGIGTASSGIGDIGKLFNL